MDVRQKTATNSMEIEGNFLNDKSVFMFMCMYLNKNVYIYTCTYVYQYVR